MCSDIPTATKNSSSASNPACIPTSMGKLAHSSQSRFPRPFQPQTTYHLLRTYPQYTAPSLTPMSMGPSLAPLLASLASNTIRTLRTAADSASAVTADHTISLVPMVCIGILLSKCVTILQPRNVSFAIHHQTQQLTITETRNCRTASWPKWHQSDRGHESTAT